MTRAPLIAHLIARLLRGGDLQRTKSVAPAFSVSSGFDSVAT